MKRYLLLLLLAAAHVSAQSVQTTTVTGTVRDFFGVPLRNAEYRILEVQRKGMIIPLTPPHHGYTDSLGALSFVLPRSNYATQDTTKFRIYINAPEYNKNGDRGVWLALPDTSTVTLSTLPRSTYTPPGVAVIVQNIGGGTTVPYGDSIYVADSLARLARNEAAGKPPRDSTVALYDSLATHWGLIAAANALAATARDIANGKGDADSLKAGYDSLAAHLARISATEQVADGAIQESDSASLHAQKFADRPTRTEVTDTLNANVVRAEVDPTATAKAQAVVEDSLDAYSTNGTRGVSSSKRIFAQMDSITFIGEAGDVIDLSLGNNFRGTISANDTLSFSNAVDGQVIQVVITNAGTHTLSWSGVSWPGGTQPTLTAVANKRSIYSFIVSGGMVHGVAVLNY